MATATKTRTETKVKVQEKVQVEEQSEVPETPAVTKTATAEALYLITGQGLEILIGAEGDWVREKIKNDDKYNHLSYKHYDDDKRVWAIWAVLDSNGETIKPILFPDPSEYGMTPPELYTKAVTFKGVISEIVQILGEEKETIWDKMAKPSIIIISIITILAVLGFVIIAAGG